MISNDECMFFKQKTSYEMRIIDWSSDVCSSGLLTRARFTKGIASKLDVRQAQTSYDQARSDIAETTTLVAQDRNALNLLAGTTIATDLLPERLNGDGVTLAQLPANLPSSVLLQRPDIAAAEHRLRAAKIGRAHV